MAVAVGHELIGFFGSCVQANGVVDRVCDGKGYFGVSAVHAGAAGIYEVLHAVVAAGFEHVAKADEVALDVGLRVGERVAHAGLRGQVNDALGLLSSKDGHQACCVCHVGFDEAELLPGAQLLQPGFFEGGIVVVVEVVQANDFVAACQQYECCVHANKAGRTCEEDFHSVAAIEIAGIDFVGNVLQTGGLPICNDDVAALLEVCQVVDDG